MPASTDPLHGKVVLLSGATGVLGSALAHEVLRRGGRLGIAVRRPWQVQRLVETYGSVGTLVGHVPSQDGEAAAGFVKGVTDALGPIAACICAAGSRRESSIGKDPAGELAELLEANLLAGANLARAVVGPMRRRRTGSLVFVGSAEVGTDGAGSVGYLAAKAALHEYVRALSAELGPCGVRVAAVLPTILDTPANRQRWPEADHRRWQAVDRVVGALLDCAFGPAPTEPLLRLSGQG